MATVPYTQYTFANKTGNVALNRLDSNFSNINSLVNNAITVTAGAQANITSVGTLTSLTVLGNITTSGRFVGNGAALTGVVASNANAVNLVGNTLSSNVLNSILTSVGTLGNLRVAGPVSASGNITGGNIISLGAISTTGQIFGGYFYGNGSQLTGQIANAAQAATVYASAQPAITSVGALTSLSVTGNIKGGNLVVGNNVAMLSNVARYTWVSNLAPGNGQGSIGDIWYQYTS
jgi:hypothetical protein